MSTVFESNGLSSGEDDQHLEANGHNTVDEDITNMSNGISRKRDVKASNPGAVLPGCSPPTNKTDIGKAYAAVPLNDQPSLRPRKLRAIIIGAGYSGLTLAHKLRYQHPEMEDILTYKIFEARSDIGGTWLANTYPGVQCDVPAHIYVRN